MLIENGIRKHNPCPDSDEAELFSDSLSGQN